MRMKTTLFAVVATTGFLTAPVHAQSMPGMGGMGNMGNAGGIMGNMAGNAVNGLVGRMLPNLSSASTGNIAGILNYCVTNNYVSGNGATTALNQLTGQQNVTSSPDFAAGQQGQILTNGMAPVSLADLKGQLKTKICNMVLSRAKNLL